MDGTIRIRTVAVSAASMVVAVLCTLLVTQAWSADAAPGDADSTFVPTAGCRVVDTRPAPNTVGLRTVPLGAGDIFEVAVHGANGDCTGTLAIPTDAVGVALNVTAVNATANSNIRVFPADLVEVPTLSNLNVTAGAPPTPNKVDVKLSPDGKIKVFNFRGSVNIFIDVVGYYTNATLQELSQRVVASEARIDVLETATAALDAAQPFTVVSETINPVSAGTTPTEIVSVTITAPVDGQVATIAAGYMTTETDGQFLLCGLMDSVTDVPAGEQLAWQKPPGGVASHLSATRVFDIAANEVATYYIVCNNIGGGSSTIWSPRVTAIFTPAP